MIWPSSSDIDRLVFYRLTREGRLARYDAEKRTALVIWADGVERDPDIPLVDLQWVGDRWYQPRDMDEWPYSYDERRVATYLNNLCPDIGSGDDPIGFIVASHAALVQRAREKN